MEKQKSFRGVTFDRHPTFHGHIERQQSFHGGLIEKQKSFKGLMEKQKSFKGLIEKKKSFQISKERQMSFGGDRRRGQDSPGKKGDSQLHLAARAGNLIKVKDMFHKFTSDFTREMLSKQNQEGEIPLYISAEKGHVDIVGEFLKYLNVESASIAANNGYDSFHIAARQGHCEVLKQLLQFFPNLVMTTDSSNSTALHTAAAQGHIDIVNLLLDTDCNLAKISRNNGKTVLHTAARMGYLEVVQSLLKKDPTIGFRTDKKGQTALLMAVKGQNVEIVLELIKPDSSVLGLADNKGNTALHIATSKRQTQMKKNGRFHMVLRSKHPNLIARLPDEIIFNILVLLPAHILYAVMRYVCRQWNLIINDPTFVTTHHRRATSICLLQDPLYRAHFFYVTQTDTIKFSDVKFQFPGVVLGTCNGLTLVRDTSSSSLYYIANPATNRVMTLPAMPSNHHWSCLTFAASSNTYKVVLVTRHSGKYRSKYKCSILTVNVDREWRLINCANMVRDLIFTRPPIVNSGFVYWGWGNNPSAGVLALNIESETVKTISLPPMRLPNCYDAFIRSKGNTISLIHVYRDCSIYVWVLEDHESQEWVEFPDLIVEELRREVTNSLPLSHLPINHRLIPLFPVCWLTNEEKILFEMIAVSNSLLVYDVKTGGAFTFIIDIDGLDMRNIIRHHGHHGIFSAIFPHLSSLTWV